MTTDNIQFGLLYVNFNQTPKMQTTVLCTRQSNEPEDSLKQNIVDEIPWNRLANKSVFFMVVRLYNGHLNGDRRKWPL